MTNGPAVAETMPPIPIHMNIDRNSGGFQATIPAKIRKRNVEYLLIRSSYFSAFSALNFVLGTIDNLNISFAKICVKETTSPSDVDITAERTATAKNAAINGGKISVNNVGITASALIS